jgi:Holliday junction resolvase RusA-like endonuclease
MTPTVEVPSEIMIEHPGTPIAKGRARSTKTGRHYTPAQTKQAEQALAVTWTRATGNHTAPHTGPVSVRLQFIFTPPTSWPKWKRELATAGLYPHLTKPDTDNLIKLVKDSLNGLAWIDDAQINNVHGRKFYGPESLTRLIFTFHPAPPTTQPKGTK